MWLWPIIGLCDQPPESESERSRIVGRVTDVDGHAAAGATVTVEYHQQHSAANAVATTDPEGQFSIVVDAPSTAFERWQIVARSEDDRQAAFFRHDRTEQTLQSRMEIRLEPTRSRLVRVVDADSEPVADALVTIGFGYPHSIDARRTDAAGRLEVLVPQSERIDSVMAWKDRVGFDYEVYALGRNQRADLNTPVPEFPGDGQTLTLRGATPVIVSVVDNAGDAIQGVRLYPWLLRKPSANDQLNLSFFADSMSQVTDASGTATFAWMPTWQETQVTIWPTIEGYSRTRANYDSAIDAGKLRVTLDRLVAITGRVTNTRGKPAGGIMIEAKGAGYGIDDGRGNTMSREDGTYEILVDPEQIYMVTARDDDSVANAVPTFVVNSGSRVDGIDLQLREPTRLTGQLTAQPSGQPLAGERVIIYQHGDDLSSVSGAVIANPENSRRYVRPTGFLTDQTDDQGHFEFLLGDGSYDIRPPRQEKAEKFEVSGESTLNIDITTEIQSKVKLAGVIRHAGDSRPAPGIRVEGVSQRFSGDHWQATTGADGTFALQRLAEPTYVYATSPDGTLGMVAILPAGQNFLEMQIEKVGAAYGVLHQSDSQQPAAKTKIRYGIRVPSANSRAFKQVGGCVSA